MKEITARSMTAATGQNRGLAAMACQEPLASAGRGSASRRAGGNASRVQAAAAANRQDGCQVPALHSGEVHVWSADLDTLTAKLPSLLTADELERANRFTREPHRSRFIQGRSLLRVLLGGYLQAKPDRIRFSYGALGKPWLPDHSELKFNVSHSANMVVIACTTSGAVGIDVEQRRVLKDEAELVERFFQSAEVSEYAALPPSLRTAGFYNGWTRKEAILKARGDGLSTPLDSFSVFLDPRKPCRIREFLTLGERQEEWSLIALEPDEKFPAALAVRARRVRLIQFRVQPDFLESPVASSPGPPPPDSP